MTIGIRLTNEDVKTMLGDDKGIVLDSFLWYYSKQVDVFADHEFQVAGWHILGYDRNKQR